MKKKTKTQNKNENKTKKKQLIFKYELKPELKPKLRTKLNKKKLNKTTHKRINNLATHKYINLKKNQRKTKKKVFVGGLFGKFFKKNSIIWESAKNPTEIFDSFVKEYNQIKLLQISGNNNQKKINTHIDNLYELFNNVNEIHKKKLQIMELIKLINKKQTFFTQKGKEANELKKSELKKDIFNIIKELYAATKLIYTNMEEYTDEKKKINICQKYQW